MNSKILKLDAPYNIIYDAHQYAMIDEGGELAAGALAVEAELSDCRVICNESDPRVRLRWLAEIIEYDMRQEDPVEFHYIWERLSLFGVKVIWDKARDEKGELLKDEDGELIDENVYTISLTFEGTHSHMVAQSYTTSGFYFYARGKVEDVYNELYYQLSQYETAFHNDYLLIKFKTIDSWEQHIVDLLNQRNNEYKPAPDEEHLI